MHGQLPKSAFMEPLKIWEFSRSTLHSHPLCRIENVNFLKRYEAFALFVLQNFTVQYANLCVTLGVQKPVSYKKGGKRWHIVQLSALKAWKRLRLLKKNVSLKVSKCSFITCLNMRCLKITRNMLYKMLQKNIAICLHHDETTDEYRKEWRIW